MALRPLASASRPLASASRPGALSSAASTGKESSANAAITNAVAALDRAHRRSDATLDPTLDFIMFRLLPTCHSAIEVCRRGERMSALG
jgi:hypothetical protein